LPPPQSRVGGRWQDRTVRPAPPELLVLGGIGSVQFGAAFANELFDEAGPGGVVFLRLLLSAAILLAIARPTMRGRTRADWTAVLMFGLVLGAMNWSFYEAIHRLPLGVAVTIEFTGPLTVAIAGSRRLLDGLWVIFAGAGVVLLALRGGHHGVHATGVVLALVAAACWALYILLSQRVGRTFAQLDGLAIALGIGVLVVVPVGIIQGGDALLRPHVIGGGLAVALLSSLIPYSFELMALRRLTAYRFGLLMSLEPAVAALAGVIVLGQPLTAVLGVALVLVAVASIGNTLTASQLPEPHLEA
jgi:inner membrane transporter RhtA